MSHRLRTEEGKALYKRRGATVEPAIGNLKKILDRFSRRGLNAALGELQLAATACNRRIWHGLIALGAVELLLDPARRVGVELVPMPLHTQDSVGPPRA